MEIVRDNLQKTINGSGIDHLVLGARFRDIGFKNGQLADLRVFDRQLSSVGSCPVGRCKRISKQPFRNRPTNSTIRDERLLLEYYLAERRSTTMPRLQQDVLENRKAMNEFTDGLQEIMVMREMPEPRPTFVLHRGAYDSPGGSG